MKKIIALIVLFIVTLNSTILIYAKSNETYINEEIIMKVDEISSINSFKAWNGMSVKLKYILHDEEGREKALYIKIFDKFSDSNGYLIFDIDNNDLLEFSMGESPFDTALDTVVKEGKIKKRNLKLIYGENMTYIAKDNEVEIDLLNLEVDVKEGNEKIGKVEEFIEESSEFIISPKSYDTDEVIISGVSDYNVLDACGSNAGRIIVDYWDSHGYSSLIPTGKSASWVNTQLYDYMDSWEIPFIGQHATLPSGFRTGLDDYLNDYSTSGVSFLVAMSIDLNGILDYSDLKTEVDADRPGVILYNDPNEYGLHYVNFVGYSTDSSNDYYVIKDGWSTTPEYVYKNVDTDNANGIF